MADGDGPFEPLSVKCSQTHWWQCAGFTANMLVKDTLYLIRTIFVCLRKVEKSIPTHLQGDIGRPRTILKLRNRSRNVQRHLGSAGEEVRRRIWLSFWGGEESHAWFPHPLFQEDVRDFKDAKWLLAGFHPTSTSDKQPSGKVRVSYSHYFCNYILIRTILVIISLFALFCYWKGNNFLFALFRVNQHFKKSYTEYKRLNIVQSSKKLCDFLKEYDLDYRKEKEPTVAEKLLKEAETYLNKHQHVFATKDLTKSKSK